jgi:hypothetical protein
LLAIDCALGLTRVINESALAGKRTQFHAEVGTIRTIACYSPGHSITPLPSADKNGKLTASEGAARYREPVRIV